jgi:hypothetical protein
LSQTTSQSPLDSIKKELTRLFERGLSNEQIASTVNRWADDPGDSHRHRTTPRSVGRARRRWGFPDLQRVEDSYTKVNGDSAEVVTEPGHYDLGDIDGLLRDRGLDPDDWEVTNLIVSEWGALLNVKDGEAVKNGTQKTKLKQLKVTLKRKKPFSIVIPARVEINLDVLNYEPETSYEDERLVVLVGDQHAPYHDKKLHKLFLEWLHYNEPEEGVLLGDTIDLPEISRHPRDPEWAASTQACVDAAGQLLLDYRTASPTTKWTKLPGNHDERLRRAVIDRLGDFYNLRPSQIESLPELPPIHDPVHLLRLDELGIDYIRPDGSYDHAFLTLSPFLRATHGWNARKGSGASAHTTLDHLGHSIIMGHTHRQAMVEQTKHRVDGTPTTTMAVEAGCMCEIKNGLGYAVAPDWQNGFATATIWPDGLFSLDTAKYVNGALLYADQRYN